MSLLDQIFGGGAAWPTDLGSASFDPEVSKQELELRRRAARAASTFGLKPAGVPTQTMPAPSPFDAGVAPTPIPFAGMLGDMSKLGGGRIPGMGDIGGMLGGNDTGPIDAPPSTNDPGSGEPVLFKDGAPVQKPGAAEVGAGDEEIGAAARAPLSLATPATADGAPAVPPPDVNAQAPAAAAPAAPPTAAGGGMLGGIFGKLLDPNNAPTLMALASGFSGAPSFGTGMRRAFGAAGPAMAVSRSNTLKQETITSTFRALVAKGVPQADAWAAANNPDIMKAVAAKTFETKTRVPHKIGTDLAGNEIMGSFDPNSGKFFDAAGRDISAGGAGTSSTADVQIPGTGGGLLAKGVTNYNPELAGPEYLAQFSPEVKAAIEDYHAGRTMPTSNPRLKGYATKIKEWAGKYGRDIGSPIDDTEFFKRKKFQTDLGSVQPTTIGGQAKAFNQGIEHMDKLARQLEKLGNVDLLGIPMVGAGINSLRQTFSSKQSGISDQAKALGQTLAGEVGKLFSGSAGGGVHERELTRQRFSTVATPDQLAGALEGTLETMDGGLKALEQRRDSIMGDNSGIDFVAAETRAGIDRIQHVIARLRGEAPPASPAAPAAPVEPTQADYLAEARRRGLVK